MKRCFKPTISFPSHHSPSQKSNIRNQGEKAADCAQPETSKRFLTLLPPPFKKNSGSPSVVTLHYAVSSEKALCATCTLQSRLDAHQSKTFICEGLGKAYWSHIKGNRSTCGHTIRKYNWPNVNLWLLFFARLRGRNFTQIQCNETSIRKWRNGSKCCVGTKCY